MRFHPLLSRSALLAGLAAGLTVGFAACGGGDLVLPSEGSPGQIAVIAGDGQSGRVGETLADPLVVQVTDSRGRPVAGVPVAFSLDGGRAEPEVATTDADGRASVQLALGTRVGAVEGEARLAMNEGPDLSAEFSAVALPANASGIAPVSGDSQGGPVRSVLPEPLVVAVTDPFGNPIAGVTITWTVEGGGAVSAAATTTDPRGLASVERTLGAAAGIQVTRAGAEGLAGSPVVFTHTAFAGNPVSIAAVAGSGQSAPAGTTLPQDLVVRVVDAAGNGVGGVPVSWIVTTGGGSVTPVTSVTGADGLTSARWTLGGAGPNTLSAVVSGVGIAQFTATATGGGTPPAARTTTTITADNPDPSGPGAPVTVQFTVTAAGGGTPTGTVTVTDGRGASCSAPVSQGQCALTLAQPGAVTLTATYAGAAGFAPSSDTESHTVQPAPPPPAATTTTTITGDTPDPSVAGAAVTVQFTVTAAGGGTPTGDVTVTDGQGGSCSAPVSAGQCTLTIAQAGTVTLTASYAGNAQFAASSDTEGHTVEAAPPPPPPPPPPPVGTTTTITSDQPDPSEAGAAVTVQFTVTAAGGGTPTGTVTVTDGRGGSCSAPVSTGQCALTVGGAAGPVTLTATYPGSDQFAPSSDTEEHTVVAPPPPPPAATTTTITGDAPDPSTPGAAVAVSYTVTSAAGVPTGTVTVTAGPGESCTGSVSEGGCTIPSVAASGAITASYGGDGGFAPSSDTEEHTVAPPPNQPPAAAADAYGTAEDGALSVGAPGVLANDGDPEGAALTAVLAGAPAHGDIALDPSGAFTYSPGTDFAGDDAFSYQASDGAAASAPVAVAIQVGAVNDPPGFTAGEDQFIGAGAGPQTIPAWASDIRAGPPDEAGQGLAFSVSSDNGGLFTGDGQPAVSPDGTLTYTPSGQEGTATVTVVLRDDGGSSNGGSDTSPPQTFTITVITFGGGGGG